MLNRRTDNCPELPGLPLTLMFVPEDFDAWGLYNTDHAIVNFYYLKR